MKSKVAHDINTDILNQHQETNQTLYIKNRIIHQDQGQFSPCL